MPANALDSLNKVRCQSGGRDSCPLTTEGDSLLGPSRDLGGGQEVVLVLSSLSH